MMRKYDKSAAVKTSAVVGIPLPCWLLNGGLKRGFLDIYITTWFTFCNFGNTSAMRDHLLFQVVENLLQISGMEQKIWKIFFFFENSFWIDFCSFSSWRREYLSSAVYRLGNSPKNSDINTRYIFQLYLIQIDGKIQEKCCRADFSSFWHPFPFWLSKGVLKWWLLNIYLTKSFAVPNFGNT